MIDEVTARQWSSYRAMAGLESLAEFLTISWVLEQFNGKSENYRKYVAGQDILGSHLKKAVMSNVLGSDRFREDVQWHIKKAGIEVIRVQRYVKRQSLRELESETSDRSEWMVKAYRNQGYTMLEIADYAQLHYSSVSKIIKRWEAR